MTSDRDRLYFRHMLEIGEKVLAYTQRIDQAAFVETPIVQDAMIRELVGEARILFPYRLLGKRNGRHSAQLTSVLGPISWSAKQRFVLCSGGLAWCQVKKIALPAGEHYMGPEDE